MRLVLTEQSSMELLMQLYNDLIIKKKDVTIDSSRSREFVFVEQVYSVTWG